MHHRLSALGVPRKERRLPRAPRHWRIRPGFLTLVGGMEVEREIPGAIVADIVDVLLVSSTLIPRVEKGKAPAVVGFDPPFDLSVGSARRVLAVVRIKGLDAPVFLDHGGAKQTATGLRGRVPPDGLVYHEEETGRRIEHLVSRTSLAGRHLVVRVVLHGVRVPRRGSLPESPSIATTDEIFPNGLTTVLQIGRCRLRPHAAFP